MPDRGTPPQLDGFTFVDLIGQGGFADVFRYQQAMPMRQVAIKVLLASAVDGPAREQFNAEANVMAQLSGHPSIVPIYQASVSADGRPYLVMEYCPPPSLAGRFRTQRIDVPEALEIAVKISSAVETAHRAGVLHRDIKPHNILNSAYGAPMLTDFGIAAATTDSPSMSYGLSVPWAPPEAFGDEMPADPRSDVYSLAATLYSLLAGRSPFEVVGAANDNATLMSRIERQPLQRILRADVPDSLNALLARAMSKSLAERHPTAMSFARAVQDIQAELHLAPTRIEVLDASPTAAPARDDEHRTQVRPVSIIVPDGAAGTRLRPIVVQPVADERTAMRPPRLAHAEPVPDTMARGGVAAADHTDGSHFLAPPAGQVAEQDAEDRRGAAALIAGAVLVLVIVGVVIAAMLGGSGSGDDTPPARQTPSAPSASEVIGGGPGAPTDLKSTTVNTGIKFSWTASDAQKGDMFLVRTGPSPAQLSGSTEPSAERTVVVRAKKGEKVCIEIRTVRDRAVSQPASDCGFNE